jgi:hypothetical protein
MSDILYPAVPEGLPHRKPDLDQERLPLAVALEQKNGRAAYLAAGR